MALHSGNNPEKQAIQKLSNLPYLQLLSHSWLIKLRPVHYRLRHGLLFLTNLLCVSVVESNYLCEYREASNLDKLFRKWPSLYFLILTACHSSIHRVVQAMNVSTLHTGSTFATILQIFHMLLFSKVVRLDKNHRDLGLTHTTSHLPVKYL